MNQSAKIPVSVVIPTHNSETTIRRALESVFLQTQLPIEIIVVDDFSNDTTNSIVDRIREAAPIVPIKLCQLQANQGPATARNTGWNMATGTHVAFLDADDSWDPRKIEIQYKWMVESPDVVVCGTLHSINNYESQPFVSSPQVVPTRKFTLRDLLIKNRFSTPSVMMRRDISERFNDTFWYSEDYLLWLTIASRHTFVHRIELPLTILHKNTYGQGGLSGDLVPMLRGELRAIRSTADLTSMTRPRMVLAMTWLILKFIQRVPRALCRRYLHRFQSKATIHA